MPNPARIVGALLLAAATSSAAVAQITDGDTIVFPPRPERPSTPVSAFARDGDVAVLDRNLPRMVAQAVSVGPFDLFPALSITPEGTTNLYDNNANRHAAALLIERPEALLRTRGGPVDIDLYGRGRFAQVLDYATENTSEGTGGIALGSDVGPLTRLEAGASYGARALPRYAPDSPVNAVTPLRYQELDAFASGSAESGRLRLRLRGDYARLRFDAANDAAGVTLFTADRDRSFTSGLARLEYAVKPNFSLYVAGTGNYIDYRLGPPQVPVTRNSTGWGAYVGSSFEITRLIRADARVGYIRQNFNYAGFPAVSGLGLRGNVQYSPNRLWTLTASGDRSVQDSGVPGSAGLIHTGGQLQGDNELRRYLILTAVVGHYEDVYRGIVRHDRDTFAGISTTYLSRSHWNAKVGYQYSSRRSDSTAGAVPFDDHRLFAGLTFQI